MLRRQENTGNMKHKLLFLITLLITISALAEVRVNSFVEKRKISLQELLKFTIEISDESNKNIQQPELPAIPNFSLAGTSSSHSSSMQIVNGKMTSSVTISYHYQLRPQAVGKYMIPPIRVSIKGKDFITEPISIEITEGSTETLPPSASAFPNEQQNSSDKLEDNLFIVAEISKRNVYRGEPVTVSFKLYTRYTISNLAFLKEPEFNGFWKETIYRAEYNQFQRERYQGQMFNMMPLISVALFPASTGTITIPALEMSVDVRIEPRSFFDFGSTKRFTVASKPVSITVKDIPLQNRPEHFNGAIGQYKLNSNISNTALKVGDPFTYTLEITGTGNIAHFEQPVLPSVKYLRFHDPEIMTSVQDDKISGKKTIKYLVIAQEKGTFTIPAIPFTYFDTKTEKYETIFSKSYQLNVEEGTTNILTQTGSQTVVTAEAPDIRFIATNIILKNKQIYFSSFFYWFLWFVISSTILFAFLAAKEQEKIAMNLDYTRQKKANKILKKYLKKASYNAQSGKIEFYANAQNGLNSFLADKCKIPRGSTTEITWQKLHEKKLNSELINRLHLYYETCNQARFMPGGFSPDSIKNDYKTLLSLVNELSKWKLEK